MQLEHAVNCTLSTTQSTEVTDMHTLNHGISRVHKHCNSVTHISLAVDVSLGLQQHCNNSTVTLLTATILHVYTSKMRTNGQTQNLTLF